MLMKLNDLEMSTVKLIISKINAFNTEKPWLQEELFKSFDELIENNIKVLITVICDRGLLSHEQLTKQSSSIDLFLKYLNTDHKREEAFSKHCSNEHFIFLTKIEKIGIEEKIIFGKGKSKSKNKILT